MKQRFKCYINFVPLWFGLAKTDQYLPMIHIVFGNLMRGFWERIMVSVQHTYRDTSMSSFFDSTKNMAPYRVAGKTHIFYQPLS